MKRRWLFLVTERIQSNVNLSVMRKITKDREQWRIQKILVGGGFEAKTSKIRMSSPKLRVVFRPKTEIQTFFSPKIRWSPKKKKKKVFTKVESDFSAENGNSNVFFAQNQVVSRKKIEKKKKVFTRIETDFAAGFVTFRSVGGYAFRNGAELFKIEADFSAKIVTFRLVGGMHPPPKSATDREVIKAFDF